MKLLSPKFKWEACFLEDREGNLMALAGHQSEWEHYTICIDNKTGDKKAAIIVSYAGLEIYRRGCRDSENAGDRELGEAVVLAHYYRRMYNAGNPGEKGGR